MIGMMQGGNGREKGRSVTVRRKWKRKGGESVTVR